MTVEITTKAHDCSYPSLFPELDESIISSCFSLCTFLLNASPVCVSTLYERLRLTGLQSVRSIPVRHMQHFQVTMSWRLKTFAHLQFPLNKLTLTQHSKCRCVCLRRKGKFPGVKKLNCCFYLSSFSPSQSL